MSISRAKGLNTIQVTFSLRSVNPSHTLTPYVSQINVYVLLTSKCMSFLNKIKIPRCTWYKRPTSSLSIWY